VKTNFLACQRVGFIQCDFFGKKLDLLYQEPDKGRVPLVLEPSRGDLARLVLRVQKAHFKVCLISVNQTFFQEIKHNILLIVKDFGNFAIITVMKCS